MASLNHPGVLLEEYAIMHEPDWKAWKEDKRKEDEQKGGEQDD